MPAHNIYPMKKLAETVGIGYNYLLRGSGNDLTFEFIWNRSFGKSYGDELILNFQNIRIKL